MAQYNTTGIKTLKAGGALAAYRRVKLAADVLSYAGATEEAVGVTLEEAFAANDEIMVRLNSAQGTVKMTAGAAIVQGADVWGAANGKLAAAAGGGALRIGIAMEAAGADGDIIEVMAFNTGSATT